MATDITQPLRYVIDLQSGLEQTPMRSYLMKGDKKANRVIVRIMNGSETVDLSGVGVSGSFIRPPDEAELTLAGSANGNEAVIVLDDLCYAEEGYCEIDVKLTVNGVSRTVLALTGYVLAKGNGAYIDVGNVIPNIDDIIAQYAEMKAVTERTLAAAQRAEALAINASGYAANTGMLGGQPPSYYATAERANQLSQQKANKAGWAANKLIGTDENGNMVAQDPPEDNGGDADTLGGKAPGFYMPYTNLSINSDFTKWVAQAGIGGMHGTQAYGGDCWILTSGNITGVANADGDGHSNIKLNGTLVQVVPSPPDVATAFVEMVSGTAEISYDADAGEISITSAGGVIKNVLLLAGEWTEKPKYASKGYGAELAECQIYYVRYQSRLIVPCSSTTEFALTGVIYTPVPMRQGEMPTINVENIVAVRGAGNTYVDVSGSCTIQYASLNSYSVLFTLDMNSLHRDSVYQVYLSGVEFSRDL